LGLNPPVQLREACGYDPTCYISTAQLEVVVYTDQNALVARFGGLEDIIAVTDDSPSTGDVNATILNQTIANVTAEINGYISSIYPIPLAKTGTVSVLKITSVSDDGTGAVTGIEVLTVGGYKVAPGTSNSPAYLRYINPLAYQNCWGWNFKPSCQLGSGLSLTVTYTSPASTTPQTPITVSG